MEPVVIRRPPSADKAMSLAGAWSTFERHGGEMTPEHAQDIAARLYAVWLAKRQGKWMPKDWKRHHPSLPCQIGALADRIAQHPIVATANFLQPYDFELKEER